jgi:hypothetical protein
MRTLLVVLIVTATALFVVGVTLEPGGGETGHHDEGAEVAHAESRPLGIDVEATPFVAVAAVASLALAAAGWLSPRRAALIAVAMLAFAVLDAAEVFRQADRGLAILAAVVAALHLAAAAVAAAMRSPGAMAR